MKFVVVLLLIVGSLSGVAQQISGFVHGPNGPVSFASIYYQNSNVGTIADVDGKFEINTQPQFDSITIQALGYQTKLLAVKDVKNRSNIKVFLQQNFETIDEVVVNGASSYGKTIVKKAIEYAPVNNYQNKAFSVDAYIKTTLHETLSLNSKQIEIQQNLIEKDCKVYYAPNNAWLEVKKGINDLSQKEEPNGLFSSDFGGANSAKNNKGEVTDPTLFYSSIKEGNFNFYNGLMYIPKLGQMPFISPVSSLGLISYKYIYNGNFIQDKKKVHRIKIQPLRKEEALFTGEIMLLDSTWEIAGVNLSLSKNVLHYYESFNIQQEYHISDSVKTLKKQEFAYAYYKLGKIYNGKAISYFYNYNISDQIPKDFPKNLIEIIADSAHHKSTEYWELKRKIELKEQEKKFMAYSDSIKKIKTSTAFQIKQDKIKNKITFSNVFFDGIDHYNSPKGYKWRIDPLMQQARFFGVGGYRHALGGTYINTPKSYKSLTVNSTLNYGFTNKDLLANAAISKTYAPKKFAEISISGGSKYELLTYNQNLGNLLSRNNFIQNNYFQIKHSLEIFNGFFFALKAKFMERKSLQDLELNSWSDELFGNENVFNFNDYTETKLQLTLHYTPFQKYAIEENRKLIKGSKFPTFSLKWTQGIPALFNSSINYQKIAISSNQSIKMGIFGVSKYLVNVGKYIHTQGVELPNYTFFRGTDPYFFSHPLYTFQLLGDTHFSLNSYLTVNYIHHFHGSLIKKLPVLKKSKLETVLGGGYLYLTDEVLHHNELYYGAEYPFRIADTKMKIGVYYAAAYSNYSNLSNMIKFGINVFNPFTSQWAF